LLHRDGEDLLAPKGAEMLESYIHAPTTSPAPSVVARFWAVLLTTLERSCVADGQNPMKKC
jgi:hypothetical protein